MLASLHLYSKFTSTLNFGHGISRGKAKDKTVYYSKGMQTTKETKGMVAIPSPVLVASLILFLNLRLEILAEKSPLLWVAH